MSREYIGKCYDCDKRVYLVDKKELIADCGHELESFQKILKKNDVNGIELNLLREHLNYFPEETSKITIIDKDRERYSTEFQYDYKRIKTIDYEVWNNKHRDAGNLMIGKTLKVTPLAENEYFFEIMMDDDPTILRRHLERVASLFWPLIHEDIRSVSERRFNDNYIPDAILQAFKKLDKRVQKIYKDKLSASGGTPQSLYGARIMEEAFNEDNPIIKLSDVKNEQKGYKYLFKGAMQAFRNDYAHLVFEEIVASQEEAIGLIFFVSRLMYILDEVE